MIEIAGFVLTGGESSRMGRDKALLPFGATTLCERIADVVSEVCEHVLLVGHPERYGHMRYACVADLHPGLGPLSGLETILDLQLASLNVVVSCDAVNLESKWLKVLIGEAKMNGALCTVAKDGAGKLQPLCAVYRSECRETVARAIHERRLRAVNLLDELKAQTIQLDDVLFNLNTPDQYKEVSNAIRR